MMTTFTDWDIVRNLLLAGRWTVLLSLTAFIGGALVTLPLLLLRLRGKLWVQRLIRGYIELFQGTPLLMQLFLAFFGVALFGIDVSPWTAAALALTLYTTAPFCWISGTAVFGPCRKDSGRHRVAWD
ncbi:allantoate transport membrane protein [Klebsiella aerogenes]|nr:allantoate transport membrane protein [Klebsiella aerogenes]